MDALSTGALLAREAADSYRVTHVRSRAQLPETFAASLPTDLFDEDLTYPGHTDDVRRKLAERSPVGVVPASEFGVEVADELAEALALRGNTPSLSSARRDKSRMMAVLSAAGIRTPRQLRAGGAADLLRWRRQEKLGRVVVKPLDSAGSDDVFTCDTDEEVTTAFDRIIGKTNLMLRPNESVLIQEYLAGDEFIVNTVSRDGRHWCTDVWVSAKTVLSEKRKVYDYEDLLEPDDLRLEQIVPYVSDVLDGLGITNGPAHTELILTHDGPVLLETGARISGLANPPALDRCTGANQVSLALDCYTADARLLLSRPLRYEQNEHARCVNLFARRAVRLPACAIREALQDLPAFESLRFRVADNGETRPTVDLNSSPGVVFFVHKDRNEVDRAYKVLREIEHELL
ncbi:ATP-grasp domain-containing protein [Streptomyces sp. FIT100]|uniref:ATP-grasp domain-containing protein n=1 Tax=Streptomyces sp. FIT100 TaxID=2837956 RepID=UPI0021C6B9BA|nr:ATP-grasp domain-containing protein [Streptomyces sp. FIT100]UUN26974.1 ATP-grasp domain-containing protein [Streptomyces sp. FIT100]